MTIGAKQACDAAGQIARENPRRLFQEIVEPTGRLIPHWQGIPALQRQLADNFAVLHKTVEPPTETSQLRSFAASNSAVLMKIAARSLFSVGRRLLVTDLVWKNHLRLLKREARRTTNTIMFAPVRQHFSNPEFDADQLAQCVANHFVRQQCDSLFLTAVSSDGIQLPISKILAAIDPTLVRQVVVDGAQEFGHVSNCQLGDKIDAYLLSSHKWLGSHHPLSLMVYSNRNSTSQLEKTTMRLIETGEIDDSLLKFWSANFQSGSCQYDETVNISPLIAFAGAINDLNENQRRLANRQQNICTIRDLFASQSWRFRSDNLHQSLQTGIELVTPSTNKILPAHVENQLSSHGVEATVCNNSVRISLPTTVMSHSKSAIVANAFDCI